ncbi:hypothetical protein [Nonomuraea typhae]|uniref:Head decoration protein n=1 Tax=Nonomuraea typhae TaxID=2603600 RepID=A0ABW7YJW3_9ACTN
MAVKFGNGIDLQNQKAVNVGDPSAPGDGVNKQYADALVRGLSWKLAVRAATTANGTLATAYANGQTLDGVVLATGDRVLLKNQTAGAENGIYVVAASGAPARAVDADADAEIKGATVTALQGTVNADKVFRLVTDSVVIGTTAQVWTEIGGGGGTSYTAGDGLIESPAATFNVQTGAGLEVSSDAVRIAASAAGNGLTGGSGSALAVGAGTGITVSADAVAIDSSVVARRASGAIGDGTNDTLTFTHNLGTRDVVTSVTEAASPYAEITTDVEHTDLNTVTVKFGYIPTTGQYRVTVVG